jgi:hypothetical protein
MVIKTVEHLKVTLDLLNATLINIGTLMKSPIF